MSLTLNANNTSYACAQVAQNWWLSRWSDATAAADADGGNLPGAASHAFLRAYFALGVSALVCALARNYALLNGSVSATRRLHARLLTRVCSRTYSQVLSGVHQYSARMTCLDRLQATLLGIHLYSACSC